MSVETAAKTRPTDWPTQGCPRATCSAPWPRRRNHAVVPAIGSADWPRIARGASPATGTADLGAGIEGATVRKWTKGKPANPGYTKSGQVSSAVGTPAKAVAGRRRVLWRCAGGGRRHGRNPSLTRAYRDIAIASNRPGRGARRRDRGRWQFGSCVLNPSFEALHLGSEGPYVGERR